MRCKTGDGETWTTVRVRETRERLGIPEGGHADDGMISLAKAAERLKICVGSASASSTGRSPRQSADARRTWLVPIAALDTPRSARRAGVIARRPKNYENYQYEKTIRLPGL